MKTAAPRSRMMWALLAGSLILGWFVAHMVGSQGTTPPYGPPPKPGDEPRVEYNTELHSDATGKTRESVPQTKVSSESATEVNSHTIDAVLQLIGGEPLQYARIELFRTEHSPAAEALTSGDGAVTAAGLISHYKGRTDSRGRFTATGLMSGDYYCVQHSYSLLGQPQELVRCPSTEAVIEVPGHMLKVIVVDGQGNRHSGKELALRRDAGVGAESGSGSDLLRATSNSDGECVFLLAVSGLYEIQAIVPGGPAAEVVNIVDGHQHYHEHTYRLLDGAGQCRLRIEVVAEDDPARKLKDFCVLLEALDGTGGAMRLCTMAGDVGVFRDLPAGAYRCSLVQRFEFPPEYYQLQPSPASKMVSLMPGVEASVRLTARTGGRVGLLIVNDDDTLSEPRVAASARRIATGEQMQLEFRSPAPDGGVKIGVYGVFNQTMYSDKLMATGQYSVQVHVEGFPPLETTINIFPEHAPVLTITR